MGFVTAPDLIEGNGGSVQITIDGTLHEIAQIRTLSAEIDKEKFDFKVMGKRGRQHKATGWNGTGDVTVYFTSSFFTKILIDYANGGKDIYAEIVVENAQIDGGKSQRVWLGDVNFDSGTIANIDVDADYLEQDLAFTFSEVALLDQM